MPHNFKVVFNRARSSMMVVNELSSSVHGKGSKRCTTVIAAAVSTMIAGVAMAAEQSTTPPENPNILDVSSSWQGNKSNPVTVDVVNIVKNPSKSDFMLKGGEGLTIRGNGKEFIIGDLPTGKLQMNNVKFGDPDAKVNGGRYDGVLNFAFHGNKIQAGNWTFGDIWEFLNT